MAAETNTEKTAEVIAFPEHCHPVTRTDRKRRLPPVTSAETTSIFEHLTEARTRLKRAA